MASVLEVSGGGAFLVRSLNPDDLFTPEDLTDERWRARAHRSSH